MTSRLLSHLFPEAEAFLTGSWEPLLVSEFDCDPAHYSWTRAGVTTKRGLGFYDRDRGKKGHLLLLILSRPAVFPPVPVSGPVLLGVTWRFRATKTHPAGTPHVGTPDVDNLAACLMDALNGRKAKRVGGVLLPGWSGPVWVDDRQVVLGLCLKVWSREPGISIRAYTKEAT